MTLRRSWMIMNRDFRGRQKGFRKYPVDAWFDDNRPNGYNVALSASLFSLFSVVDMELQPVNIKDAKLFEFPKQRHSWIAEYPNWKNSLTKVHIPSSIFNPAKGKF